MAEQVLIVGAGPVGCTLAVLLAQKGFTVQLLERRPDPRGGRMDAGRSINLALSARGLAALERVGLREVILRDAVAMPGRLLHPRTGALSFIPYSSVKGHAIQSVSRATLNLRLLERALSLPGVSCEFDCRAVDCDPEAGTVTATVSGVEAEMSGAEGAAGAAGTPGAAARIRTFSAPLVVGSDGGYSALRAAMLKREGFDYSQSWLSSGFKEIHMSALPAGGRGGPHHPWRMSPHGLHIWPRGRSMMIGLPNADGSFTCTIFWPWTGEGSFAEINSSAAAAEYFQREYPDFPALVPDFAQQFERNPTGSLVTVRCTPWSVGRTVLLGDAAHAIVPFFGQGVNAGLTGATILADALARNHGNHRLALVQFEQEFRGHANAIADMALANFIEMRSSTTSRSFRARKWLEQTLHRWMGDRYLPLYEMVSFTTIPYADARRRASQQWERVRMSLIAAGGVLLALLAIACLA